MKQLIRIIIAIKTGVISVIAYTALGAQLHLCGVQGPLVGSDYLTEWGSWRFVVLGLSLLSALLFYGITFLIGPTKRAEDKTAMADRYCNHIT